MPWRPDRYPGWSGSTISVAPTIPTTECIGYIARRLRGRPVLLLVTARPEDLGAPTRARILRMTEGDRLPVHIELARLTRSDIAAMVSAARGGAADPGLVDALFERSEGLTLYVVEELAAPMPPGDSIPGSVAMLLGARLDSVGDVATQVLSAAAVIGRSFDLEIVRAGSGRTEEETVDGLDEAVRRGLVQQIDPGAGDTIRYDFTHGRLRDIAYDRLSLARRRLLHARVADAMRSTGRAFGSEVDRWSIIARHETSAGRAPQAAEAHRRAADLARSVFANAEARDHFEAALALAHPAVAELHEALGDVLTLLGDYDGALGHFEAAEALPGLTDAASIEHRIGLILARRGDWARAELRLAAALELGGQADQSGVGTGVGTGVGPDVGPGLRSRILIDRGAIAHRRGDRARASALAAEALAVATGAGDVIAIARARNLLGIRGPRSRRPRARARPPGAGPRGARRR